MTKQPVKCKFCDYNARWKGLCLGCFERTGAGDEYRRERHESESRAREQEQAEREGAAMKLIMDMVADKREWWEISDRLNGHRYLHRGRPWSSDIVRNVYLAATADDWD